METVVPTFVGITAKHLLERVTELVMLVPRESTDVTHELANGCDFTSFRAGAYAVEPTCAEFFLRRRKHWCTNRTNTHMATLPSLYTYKVTGELKLRNYEH